MGILIVLHVMICILLIIIILIQAGRGGGLVEGFSGVESMFGPKTNAFLTKSTSVLATLFFLTCVTLALLSARQNRSLIADLDANRKIKQTDKQASTTKPAIAGETAKTDNPTANTDNPKAEEQKK